MGMNRTPRRAFLLTLLAVPACQSAATADLAQNDSIYQATAYATRLPGDRTVFLAPLADERTAPVDAAAVDYPILYDADQRWERPVVDMVDEVLRREIEDSSVFAAVLAQPAAADVVLVPSLVAFATAAIEQESGGRALAEVGIRVRAYGAPGGDGARTLLLDQIFGDRTVTDIAFRTASRHVLAGTAVRATLLRLLQGLDSKNVGRNGMPVAAPSLGLPPSAKELGLPAPVGSQPPAAPATNGGR